MPNTEPWDPYWAKTLRIDFFVGKWDFYRTVTDARAEWLENTFGLPKDRPVLSCGCGEGGIELALARRGYEVTGLDLSKTFVDFANDRAAYERLPAKFMEWDLRHNDKLPQAGSICMFDTIGLMSRPHETNILARMANALDDGGIMLIDSPQRQGLSLDVLRPQGSYGPVRDWWSVRDGYLLLESDFNTDTGEQQIDLQFMDRHGNITALCDPYDETRSRHTGVKRYVYPEDELSEMMTNAGLSTKVVEHQRNYYYMTYGRKK